MSTCRPVLGDAQRTDEEEVEEVAVESARSD